LIYDNGIAQNLSPKTSSWSDRYGILSYQSYLDGQKKLRGPISLLTLR